MSEHEHTRPGRDGGGAAEEQAVRRLLAAAGPRPELPRDDLDAITAAARTEWRRRYGHRGDPAARPERAGGIPEQPEPAAAVSPRSSRPGAVRPARRWLALAAAAAVVAALGVAWWASRTDSRGFIPAVASVEVVAGEVRTWRAGGDGPMPLPADAPGRTLAAGSTIETASGAGGGEAGRLALRTAGGASLRLDAGTRVRLASAERIELTRGAVYVDSGAGPGGRAALAVATAAGVFHELGTQYEVRIAGDGADVVTRLRVREGRVALDRGGEPEGDEWVAAAGEELVVRPDGGIDRAGIGLHGPDWDWVVATAPRLEIEGLPVRAFLDWIARETGLRVEFADVEAAALADSVVLHGSVAHLTPLEALGPVLSSAGLGHRLTDGSLIVFAAD